MAHQTSFINMFNTCSYENAEILDIWDTYNINTIPAHRKNEIYKLVKITLSDTILSVSRHLYGTEDYYWLVLLANDAESPFDFIKNAVNNDGGYIYAIKPEYIPALMIKASTDKSKFNSKANNG